MAKPPIKRRPAAAGPSQESPNQKKYAAALAKFNARQFSASLALVRQILLREPENIHALHLGGMIAFQQGDDEKAEAELRRALSLDPDFAPLLNDLGMVLTRAEKYAEAERLLVHALELLPEMPGFHLTLGNVYKGREMWTDAERHYRAAIFYKRDFVNAYQMLSEALRAMGRMTEAVKMARAAVALNPGSARALARLGQALNEAGQFEEAQATFEEAIGRAPGNMQLKIEFGSLLAGRGETKQAEALFRAVIAKSPDMYAAHFQLARVFTYTTYDDHMQQMERLLAAGNSKDGNHSSLHFALGKAYEDIGNYEKAMEHSIAGNAMVREQKKYSRDETERNASDRIANFTPEIISRLAGTGCDDETPVFVLGMPRSGTTLTEQILASHPDVFGAGELSILGGLVGDLRFSRDGAGMGKILAELTGKELREFGENYVRQLRAYSGSARFIVDKMPANFNSVGLVRLALPKAKVIYCKRSAPDNCISIFNIQFAAMGLEFGYDLGDLGHYYRTHERLMNHWHEIMPGFIFDNHYEDMIEDQEGQTRKLLEFCGLEWDPAVMSFFNTSRSVKTASKTQVRQPIYKSSVGRWRRYGKAIQPLLDALDWHEAASPD